VRDDASVAVREIAQGRDIGDGGQGVGHGGYSKKSGRLWHSATMTSVGTFGLLHVAFATRFDQITGGTSGAIRAVL
jgi:hypothetical protein